MKKFLTVLLVIAVMFTFSFSSAFAASDAEIAAQTEAMNYAENAMAAAASVQKAGNSYSAAALEYATAETAVIGRLLASDLITLIGDITETAKMNEFKNEFGIWAGIKSGTATFVGKDTKVSYAKATYALAFAENAVEKDCEGKIAEAVAKIEAIDTSVYSDKKHTVNEVIGGVSTPVDYTYKTYAEKLIADTKATLNDGTTITTSNYPTAIDTLLYGVGGKDAPSSGSLYGELKKLLTNDDAAAADARSEANIAYAKSVLAYTGKIDYYDTVKKAENDNLSGVAKNGKYMGVALSNPAKISKAEAAAINAAIMKDIEAALEVANVYYEEESADPVVEAKAVTAAAFKTGVIDKAKAAIAVYDDVADLAADKKAALLFDGTKMYDDAAIDEALAADKTEIYAKAFTAPYTTAYTDNSEVAKVAPVTDPVANAIAAAVKKFQPAIKYSGSDKTAEADKKYCKNFYATEAQDDYQDIADDTIDALNEAKTVEEVQSIMAAADNKLAELRTAEQQKNLKSEDVTKYENALTNYVNSQKALMGSDYRNASFQDVIDKYNGTQSQSGDGKFDTAKDVADLAALFEEAKGEVAKIQKDAELKAEASKVATLLAALPATVDAKLTTEDQFMAAKDAYEAYLALYGTQKADVKGYAVFESKLATLKTAQQNAVNAAAADLADLKPYGVEDKAAVDAVRAQYDKYVEYYDQYDETFTATITELEVAEAAVRMAEIKAVKAQIMKLSENSTAAEVKAAKDAYDALTGSQQRAVKAALGEAFLYKLQIIEKAEITAVESLKIKASSKATKGAITVKWTVKGDAEAADGYQIWKSTKKNSGFKKAFTTSKTTYKNTKGLKKGVKYYYKVRAYIVVDGKNVYSDWSNKAYRTAK